MRIISSGVLTLPVIYAERQQNLEHTFDGHHPLPSKSVRFVEGQCIVGEPCEQVPIAPMDEQEQEMHWDPQEESTEFWYQEAKDAIKNTEKSYQNMSTKKAKYSIIFLGDGMGIPTITAGRIFKGQNKEKMINAEAYKTSIDLVADDGFVGLSKTYCIDRQTTDSAASATAYLTGVKAMYQTIGLNGAARLADCSTQIPKENHVESVLKKAKKAGLATGVVTTTRIHHASPSGTYANTAYRNWYSDDDLSEEDRANPDCKDLAQQAYDHMENGNIDVMLGGGYKYFIGNDTKTPFGSSGKRWDRQDLIAQWKEKFPEGSFFHTQEELLNTPIQGQKMFGLFSDSDMDYKLDTADDPDNTQPSLAEMVQTAIDNLLAINEDGFYLFVEGGRIDHAHHGGNAAKSLGEFVDFDDAIEVARSHPKLSQDETMVVITADHSHVFAMGGYGWRGYNILGPLPTDIWGLGQEDYVGNTDKMPSSLVGYINGLGYRGNEEDIPEGKHRADLRKLGQAGMTDKNYLQQTAAPMQSETHGGEDVAIVARGPWSHLFKGIHQQTYVAHVMMKAQCLGDYAEDDHCLGGENSSSGRHVGGLLTMLLMFLIR